MQRSLAMKHIWRELVVRCRSTVSESKHWWSSWMQPAKRTCLLASPWQLAPNPQPPSRVHLSLAIQSSTMFAVESTLKLSHSWINSTMTSSSWMVQHLQKLQKLIVRVVRQVQAESVCGGKMKNSTCRKPLPGTVSPTKTIYVCQGRQWSTTLFHGLHTGNFVFWSKGIYGVLSCISPCRISCFSVILILPVRSLMPCAGKLLHQHLF